MGVRPRGGPLEKDSREALKDDFFSAKAALAALEQSESHRNVLLLTVYSYPEKYAVLYTYYTIVDICT